MELQRETDSHEAQQDLSRRERERLLRRRLMLQAARAVFAEKGYSNATLDEIAQRAEFGKGTLYNYFEGGKEEILYAIIIDHYDSICRIIEETFNPALVREKPFREVFSDFLTALFGYFQERTDQFLIMMKEGHQLALQEPEKLNYAMQQGERVIDALTPSIETAVELGVLRPLPAKAIAHMIVGNVTGYQMHHCLEGCRGGSVLFGGRKEPAESNGWKAPTPAESAQFIATFLLDGIVRRD